MSFDRFIDEMISRYTVTKSFLDYSGFLEVNSQAESEYGLAEFVRGNNLYYFEPVQANKDLVVFDYCLKHPMVFLEVLK